MVLYCVAGSLRVKHERDTRVQGTPQLLHHVFIAVALAVPSRRMLSMPINGLDSNKVPLWLDNYAACIDALFLQCSAPSRCTKSLLSQ